ncbi:MAG: cyclic nucleotide-binding domain-containing protein [bacterium]|nr:cyclic nucleotide-binding domain-containing protein [bacterium]
MGHVHIATLKEGEIFGEMALFERLGRSATATALGDTRLLTVDRKKFFAGISRDPTLAFKILEAMSARTRLLNTEYTKLKKQQFESLKAALDLDQVCALILDEARRVVDADNGSVMLIGKDGQTLRIVAAFGTERAEKITLKVGDGIAGKVLASYSTIAINSALSFEELKKATEALTRVVNRLSS